MSRNFSRDFRDIECRFYAFSAFFRDIKYPRLLKVRFLARLLKLLFLAKFNTRDVKYRNLAILR